MKRPFREVSNLAAGPSNCLPPPKSRRFSVCQTSSRHQSKWHQPKHGHQCRPTKSGFRCCPESLLDLASKACASTVPFQLVEEHCKNRVPQPVMQKLIRWSFPRHESDIRRYSALSCENMTSNSHGTTSGTMTSSQTPPRSGENVPSHPSTRTSPEAETRTPEADMMSYNGLGVGSATELEGTEVAFEQGVALAEIGRVKEALQIGFHLSGTVECDATSSIPGNNSTTQDPSGVFHVAITFDRCKITSASCDCNSGDIFFCRHVVALSIYRIRKPYLVTIRSPISDTLQEMDRDQLQKLTQYLLAHHNRVLPTAQKFADELIDPKSEINCLNGAPDPTAGAGVRDDNRWSLEDGEASRHVASLLQNTNKPESSLQLQSLLSKVRGMLRARDSNGSRLLTLITEELMRHCSGHSHTSVFYTSTPQQDVCRILWDQLGLLWVCVVLNPHISSEQREGFLSKLENWGSKSHCPPESGEETTSPRAGENTRRGRNVFSRSVDAGSMRWDDPHLKKILEDDLLPDPSNCTERHLTETALFDHKGRPLWHEYVPTACARVEALRSHGYEKEAISLACAISRTIKQKWIVNLEQLRKRKAEAEASSEIEIPKPPLSPGLIGHPLRPIHILFDTMTSLDRYDVISEGEDAEDTTATRKELIRCAAFEVALLTLGQQRSMPEGIENQEKMVASEVDLIRRLNKLRLNQKMLEVLRNVCRILIDGGPLSGLGHPVHRDAVPLHCLANYLFHSLLPYDRDLAFRVGNRAMMKPVLYRTDPNSVADWYVPNFPTLPYDPVRGHDLPHPRFATIQRQPGTATRWYIIDKLDANQCTLASALIQTAKGEVMRLREVIESVQRNVGNPNHIFQLSHDAYKAATPPMGTPDSSMLNVAMQLAMQVLRMTIHGGSWRRPEMVGWLVTCATEIGLCALISVVNTWYTLFTPVEASTVVANCVVSPNTAMRLNLDPRQRDELFRCVCKMSLECAAKDPQSCALGCLTLCENLPSAFDASYHVIIDSSNKRRIDASHLYTIARYLDQRCLRSRAFTVAFAATRCLSIAFNHDTHPAVSDLLWTMQLAQSLGRNELTQMVSVVSRNVKCASVLSEVLRTCTSSVNCSVTSNLANFGERSLSADGPVLHPLLEVAISAYVSTIHSKLSHISPRHYTEFIDFLNKARETFLLSSNGHTRFAHLKENLKMVYKGKKKLLNLVSLRFG